MAAPIKKLPTLPIERALKVISRPAKGCDPVSSVRPAAAPFRTSAPAARNGAEGFDSAAAGAGRPRIGRAPSLCRNTAASSIFGDCAGAHIRTNPTCPLRLGPPARSRTQSARPNDRLYRQAAGSTEFAGDLDMPGNLVARRARSALMTAPLKSARGSCRESARS